MDTNTSDPDHALDGPILSTFLRYLIPSIVGLLAMTSANIVDGIFIGNYVGIEALAAINLIMPFLSLMFGVGLMLSLGGSVRAGKYLGEKNPHAASAIFSKILITVTVYGLIVVAAGLVFKRAIFTGLGATEALFPVMSEYYTVILPFLLAQLGIIVLYFFIRLDGFPGLASLALVIGAVLNVVLDYVFIAHYQWGLSGAAYATGVSQILPLLVLTLYFTQRKRALKLKLNQKNWKEVFQAAYNGISEFINEISAGIIAFILNWLLMQRAGVDGVAAITVVNYLLMIGFMVFFSVADTGQVMISQNVGARSRQGVKQFLIVAQVHVVLISAVLIWLLVSQSEALIFMFIDKKEEGSQALLLAKEFISYIWPVFLFAGTNMLISSYLTAAHLSHQSALVATCRSLILPTSLLIIFSLLLSGYEFVIALPVAEIMTFILAIGLFIKYSPGNILDS